MNWFALLISVHCLSYEPNHEMSVQVFTKKMSESGQQLSDNQIGKEYNAK